MSAQSEGGPTSETTDEDRPESKIFYCEICQVPCMSSITLQTHFAGLKHKKKERSLKSQREPVKFEEPQSVRKPLPINIKSLKDYVNDPTRPEPLIGLEYVIEIRFKGRKEPSYECQLCEFSTEMVPMIEHLTGQKHRKTYLGRHHPDKGKRYPNEDKALYLKRVARMVEKEEGIKKYKCEFYERPCVPSAAAKRKGKGTFKHQNNPIRKKNALQYMNTKFEITSDTEATLVINIAQTLSDSLKTFCENKQVIAHLRNLPPLMQKEIINKNQESEYEFMDEASEYEPTDQASTQEPTDQASNLMYQASKYESIYQASEYEPAKPFENYIQGDKKWNEDDKRTWNQGYNWNIGHLTNGIAQLKSLLNQTSSISLTPSDSNDSQKARRVLPSGVNAKNPAPMPVLQTQPVALQPENVRCGINERMPQFNKPAPVNCQSVSANQKPPFFTSPRGSHPTRGCRGNGTKVPNNRMMGGRIRPWNSTRNPPDSRDYPLAPVSYPIPRGYQTNYPSQGFPSWCGDGSMSGNEVPAPFPSENNTGWPQFSNFRGGVRFPPPFSGNPCSNYQQLNTQVNNLISGSNSSFTANIMSQLRGKDVGTLTAMLQQLVPHYPDLQKINIHALARALSEMS